MSDHRLATAYAEASRALEKLSKLFLPECKIGFVMWTPGKPKQCLFVGDEPIAEAAATLAQLSEQQSPTGDK